MKSLNRLKNATENVTPNGGSAVQWWRQTFVYDRYGNRNFDEVTATTLPKNCVNGSTPVVCAADVPRVNPAVDLSSNTLIGYQFDNAGNTKTDAENRSFIYDSENKQVKVTEGSTVIGEYSYDGDGKRIKKIVLSTGEVTVFVYDAAGKLEKRHPGPECVSGIFAPRIILVPFAGSSVTSNSRDRSRRR